MAKDAKTEFLAAYREICERYGMYICRQTDWAGDIWELESNENWCDAIHDFRGPPLRGYVCPCDSCKDRR